MDYTIGGLNAKDGGEGHRIGTTETQFPVPNQCSLSCTGLCKVLAPGLCAPPRLADGQRHFQQPDQLGFSFWRGEKKSYLLVLLEAGWPLEGVDMGIAEDPQARTHSPAPEDDDSASSSARWKNDAAAVRTK